MIKTNRSQVESHYHTVEGQIALAWVQLKSVDPMGPDQLTGHMSLLKLVEISSCSELYGCSVSLTIPGNRLVGKTFIRY